MATSPELACIYAALALYDNGIEINADKMTALISAADINIEPIWPIFYAKALNGVDIKALISNVGSGVGSVPAPVSAPVASTASAPAAAAPVKEKEKEESDDDMGFGLFD